VEGGGVPAPLVRPARGQMVAIETRPPLFPTRAVAFRRGYLVPRSTAWRWRAARWRWSAFRKEVTWPGCCDILSLAPRVAGARAWRRRPVVEILVQLRPYTPERPAQHRPHGDVAGLLVGATGTIALRDLAHADHRAG
jgi:hypothetical protein